VNVFSVGNTLYAKGPLLDEGGGSGGFGLFNSYTPPSLSGYQPPYTLLDEGRGSGGFSITNSYNPPLGGFGSSGGSSDPPLWQQILGGLSNLSSILDPYIFTEQERAQIELKKAQALAEAERARAEAEAWRASIQVQPAVPAWVWVAVVGLGVVALVLLLKE
jgi:hypothetical protein